MNDNYDNMADATYPIKVASCSRCASRRVIISSGRVDPAGPKTEVWTISCGNELHIGCNHNISARHLEDAIAKWNGELYAEVDRGIGELDWAKEIVRRW